MKPHMRKVATLPSPPAFISDSMAKESSGSWSFFRKSEPHSSPISGSRDLEHILRQRIRDLESEVKFLRESPLDLSRFDDAELTVLASESATRILLVAREDVRNKTSEAQTFLDRARGESEKIVAAATRESKTMIADGKRQFEEAVAAARADVEEILSTAQATASAQLSAATAIYEETMGRAKSESEELLQTSRLEAEELVRTAQVDANSMRQAVVGEVQAIRDEANEKAKSLMDHTKAQASQIMTDAQERSSNMIEQATEKKNALLRQVQEQKRYLQTALKSAATVQKAFSESFDAMRQTMANSIEHLQKPNTLAQDQIRIIDEQMERSNYGITYEE